MSTALEGVRILDMTSVVMGPYATQLLGDYGADVIKIESPYGDTTRRILPARNPDMGSTYLHLNRNKRSVVLDLKHPDGIAAFFKLTDFADVVLYSIRPQAMDRLGISYQAVSARNPRIIMLGLVGFSEDGPYAGKPVYEDLIQGLTAVPGLLESAGSEHPHYVPVAFNDRGVGLHGAVAILAALHRRAQTGRGQEIQIPMFETMAQFVLGDHLGGLTFEPAKGPPGSRRTLIKERRPYPTRDGYICVIVYTDKQWRAFFDLIGQNEAYDADPRLKDLGARMYHSRELYQIVAAAMKERTTREWLDALDKADIPATPLNTLETIFDDAHLKETNFFNRVDHPSEGAIYEMRVPSKWSDTPPSIRRPAPRLGEHSIEVLAEAGFSSEQIDDLIRNKVTSCPTGS